MAVIIYFFLIAGIEMIVQFFLHFFTVALHIYMKYIMCIPVMSVFPLLLLTQRRGRAIGYVIELFILFMGNSQ